jgi:hypothetical protein
LGYLDKYDMTGLWVALARRKTVAEIRAVLADWFPELAVADWDLYSTEQTEEVLKSSTIAAVDILFQVEYNDSEFPTVIHLDRFPGLQDEEVVHSTMLALARMFASTFACRTITDGSGCGDDDSPCWAIIWDKDRAFLADICHTQFGDQTGKPVKVVREIPLPSVELDALGRPT